MRRIRVKVDLNQARLISDLKKLGFKFHPTSQVGNGFPDGVLAGIGYCYHCGEPGMRNYLLEIKNPEASHRGMKLTPDQEVFHAKWPGPLIVAATVADVLEITDVGK